MEYRVHITDENGVGIPGIVLFYDLEGRGLGQVDIPSSGGTISEDWVNVTSSFHIDSPGYIGYAVTQLGELNTFKLVKEGQGKLAVVLLVLLGLALAGKFLKL